MYGDFSSFGLNQAYYEPWRPSLRLVKHLMCFALFLNPCIQINPAGHPNVDVILIFKIQLLEVWYSLSDLAVERES